MISPLTNLQLLANRGEFLRKGGVAECLFKPFVQIPHIRASVGMRGNDDALAHFERPVEIVPWDDILVDEPAPAKRGLHVRRQIDEHKSGSVLVRGALDLGEAVDRRGIDTGDKAKIEDEEADAGLPRKQRFDPFVETVGRPEEEIALQAHALDLAAMLCEDLQGLGAAVERGAIFGAVKAELYGVDPACAESESGTSDDDADQHASKETELKNEHGNGE